MNRTAEFVTDAVGDPEPVTAQTVCSRIEIGEQLQAGTADFFVYGNEAGSPSASPAKYAAGKKAAFIAPQGKFFQPNQVVGYVAAASGSLTMSQEEQ